MVPVSPAAVTEGKGAGTRHQPPSLTECLSQWRTPRRDPKTKVWGYGRDTFTCHEPLDHEGVHQNEDPETTHGGRQWTDAQASRSADLEEKWNRMGQPAPPQSLVGYKAMETWIEGLDEKNPPRPRRAIDKWFAPVATVTTIDQLKEVVEIYSDFSEFVFDVETRGTRGVRGLQPAQRHLARSRYEQTTPCIVCATPIPTRRRTYCSDLCRKAADKDKPALDTRTNEVWCVSLAGPGATAHVIPMGHPDKRQQLSRTEVFDALRPLFFSDRVKVNQNVGFDLLSISKYFGGVLPPGPYADIMTMIFLINENLSSYKLGDLATHYLGFTYAEKLGEEAYNVEWRRAMNYSLTDARVAWRLWRKLSPVLEQRPKLGELFDLEMRVLQVLLQMKRQGAYVDVEGFRTLRPKLEAQLAEVGADIKAMVDPVWDWPTKPFNLNSTQHLAHFLYDLKRLPCTWLTDTGQRSTAVKALKALAKRRPEPRRILEYKDVNKLLTTYVAGFIPAIDDDSRIRANFNQAVARTGRLSCSQPNLQNIPARYKESVEATLIRRLFVAPPGRVLIVADYSQIELRILAHQTKDPKLLYAYTHNQDLHTQTASLIYKVPMDEVTTEQRAIAKNSNFNFSFEGGPQRVVDMSGISLREAEKVYEAWHRAYPGVKKWGAQQKRLCLQHGYVETLWGRKRRLKDISSGNPKDRSYAERQAVNHPIQGTAADIAKIAIVRVHQALQEFHANLILQIHDEFVIECDEGEYLDAIPFIREAMEDIRLQDRPVLDVPLEATIGVGKNWSEAK